MSLELKDDDIINFKIKEGEGNDYNDDNINEKNIDENNNININNIIKKKDNIITKIPKYSFNIEKIYKNLSIDYEKNPYLFGSHYINGMHISHYMGRLLPYSLTMIEIQGGGFNCSERLFICMQKTFSSAANEKCDVRELIPEFYYMP